MAHRFDISILVKVHKQSKSSQNDRCTPDGEPLVLVCTPKNVWGKGSFIGLSRKMGLKGILCNLVYSGKFKLGSAEHNPQEMKNLNRTEQI